ncbi:MAG: hypothetical protein IKN74_06085 [Clostridia bacterium]|nr:hypothetical protein [Clostridia bacterium]
MTAFKKYQLIFAIVCIAAAICNFWVGYSDGEMSLIEELLYTGFGYILFIFGVFVAADALGD